MQFLIICNFTTIITIETNGTKIWYFDPHFITNLRQLTQFDYLTPFGRSHLALLLLPIKCIASNKKY